MIHFLPSFTFEGFYFGPFYIYSWGLAVAIGILVAIWTASKRLTLLKKIQNKEYLGISEDTLWNFSIWLVIAIFLGARISYILETWNYYSSNFSAILKLWEGGFSFFGGALGGLLFGYYWCKKKKIDFLTLGAIFTPAWLWGLFFGRIGCFLIHDHLGKPTNLPWGIHLHGAYRHEPALYEAIWILLVVLGLYLWEKKKKFKTINEIIFPLSLILYSFGRFWIDFLRADPIEGGDDRFWGLTVAQWISIVVVSGSVWMIGKIKQKIVGRNF